MNNRIKQLREEKEVLQKEVAINTGIDVRTISNLENCKTLPNAEQLVKIAKYFDVSVDYLLGLTDIKNYTNADALEVLSTIEEQILLAKKIFK